MMKDFKTYRKRRTEAAREAARQMIEKQLFHRAILGAQPTTRDMSGCRVFCLDFEILKN